MDFSDIKKQQKIHFIGLGGIGMSALAFILREFDIEVQGSDLAENYLTPKLRSLGVTYFVGHRAENVGADVSLIVETSIIKEENPEIVTARARGIPIITRAELLAIVMAEYKGVTIAGTHGKTSTTGMVSVMLAEAGLDPTVINGGVIHYFGSNSKVGKGVHLVAESDESDASFVALPTFIGAVTNLEPEHLEFKGYNGSFEKQKEYFEKYVAQIPDAGLCALCIDDVEVEKIYNKLKAQKKNLITYSASKDADLRALNIRMDVSGLTFDVEFKNGKKISDIKMPIYGKHNASNACVAIAIADFLNISAEKIKEALSKFNGVKRRFTKVGEFENVAIIDDYGHHPTEIKTTLQAARDLIGEQKLICVFEPHKYSRIASLFDEFCEAFAVADYVIVSDIYSAGQEPIVGITQDAIIAGIKNSGQKNVIKMADPKDLAQLVKPLVSKGDMIFCTGAGKVTYWAAALEGDLTQIRH